MPLKSTTKQSKGRFSILKKGACLGAEVSGLDLTENISNQKLKIIQKALVKHEVLVFKHQNIDYRSGYISSLYLFPVGD